MRKMITMAVTAALAISTLTACGKTDKKETTASTAATTASTAATTASTEAKTEAKAEAKDTSAAAAESKADAQTPVSGSVATDGSTSMEKVIGALGEAFTKANPDATFTYNPTGSGSGITAGIRCTCNRLETISCTTSCLTANQNDISILSANLTPICDLASVDLCDIIK